MRMTIVQALEFYRDADDELGYEERGYPACVAELNGVVAIADESSNGSSLEMFTARDFIDWMIEAKTGLESGEYDSKVEAVNECRRTPDVDLNH
jgi:hypothetical protein